MIRASNVLCALRFVYIILIVNDSFILRDNIVFNEIRQYFSRLKVNASLSSRLI